MLNIGIIGFGRIGRVHAETISRFVQDAKIKAIADPLLKDDDANWARSLGVMETYTDYRKIIEDKTIEALLICSSTDTHSQISLEAIKQKKHVFCEKPIDHDVNKIKLVMEALKGSKVKYQVGFNRRFDHNFKAVEDAMLRGEIGDLNILKITSRDPAPPPISYIKVSGGIFLDMTIHDFDMVRFISKAEAIDVFATGSAMVDSEIGKAGDIDTAAVTITLNNGAIAIIDNCRRASYGYDQRIEAFGSLGQIAIANDTNSTAVISNGRGVIAEKPKHFFLDRYTQAYIDEVKSFIASIVEDTPVLVNVEDGLKPVLIGLAARLSLHEKRIVSITEIEKKYDLNVL
ncbi:MAG: inositol 2-dehydrogenase [Christensenellaceae bacterium]|jgi:myo-inositol 2-dehydrogenase/D-chiro-inositol 1-dehydrogenase|nr:inositol 2-dehydrogenase [Christensenellaceae bacterium]